MLKCKELKWPYMNKILCSWHQKGLHTLAEVEAGDRLDVLVADGVLNCVVEGKEERTWR